MLDTVCLLVIGGSIGLVDHNADWAYCQKTAVKPTQANKKKINDEKCIWIIVFTNCHSA